MLPPTVNVWCSAQWYKERHHPLPHLATPCPSLPNRVQPCPTLPQLATPCHTWLKLATPCPTQVYLAPPRPACTYLCPARSLPFPTLPHLATPCHTLPYLAIPRPCVALPPSLPSSGKRLTLAPHHTCASHPQTILIWQPHAPRSLSRATPFVLALATVHSPSKR